MPWHILGIEPTRDEREIRRAYARLLKTRQHETDPAFFTRLRQAYEQALAWVGKEDVPLVWEEETAQVLKEDVPQAEEESGPLGAHESEDSLEDLLQSIKSIFEEFSGGIFIDGRDRLYTLWDRIRTHPQLESLASREEFSERLAIFLSENWPASGEIWRQAQTLFDWQSPSYSDCSLFAFALNRSFAEAEKHIACQGHNYKFSQPSYSYEFPKSSYPYEFPKSSHSDESSPPSRQQNSFLEECLTSKEEVEELRRLLQAIGDIFLETRNFTPVKKTRKKLNALWESIRSHLLDNLTLREIYSERMAILLSNHWPASQVLWEQVWEFFDWNTPPSNINTRFANALRRSFYEAGKIGLQTERDPSDLDKPYTFSADKIHFYRFLCCLFVLFLTFIAGVLVGKNKSIPDRPARTTFTVESPYKPSPGGWDDLCEKWGEGDITFQSPSLICERRVRQKIRLGDSLGDG